MKTIKASNENFERYSESKFDPILLLLTLGRLVSSAVSFYKQFKPRSGATKCRA